MNRLNIRWIMVLLRIGMTWKHCGHMQFTMNYGIVLIQIFLVLFSHFIIIIVLIRQNCHFY